MSPSRSRVVSGPGLEAFHEPGPLADDFALVRCSTGLKSGEQGAGLNTCAPRFASTSPTMI